MKLPTIFALTLGLSIIVIMGFFTVAATRTNSPKDEVSPPTSVHGFVMGRDFSALLANPNVRLSVVASNHSVVFEWTSESPARLGEVEELGHYMASAKEFLEQNGPWAHESLGRHTAQVSPRRN